MSISISNGYIIEKEMNVYDLIDLEKHSNIKQDLFKIDFKCAFGSEMESDDFEEIFEKKYRKEAEALVEEEIEDPYDYDENLITQVYANRYGIKEYDDIKINEEAVIEDITSRIILK